MAQAVSDTTEINCAHTKNSVAQQNTAQGQVTVEVRQPEPFHAENQGAKAE